MFMRLSCIVNPGSKAKNQVALGRQYQKCTYAPDVQLHSVIGCIGDERGCVRAKSAWASDDDGQGVPGRLQRRGCPAVVAVTSAPGVTGSPASATSSSSRRLT